LQWDEITFRDLMISSSMALNYKAAEIITA
jgi:hypothetical protein